MTHLMLKDELLDAQLLRVVGVAGYGGSDVGECLRTAKRINGTDLDSWYGEWSATADATAELAEREAAVGHREAARRAFLRACSYYRTAGVMLMGVPLDSRLVASNARQTDTFREAGALMQRPPEILEIPFEGVTLPGYFFAASDDGAARATVILTGGYDGTCEELYFSNGAAALARGYNVLAFDGPGQGAALLQRGLTLRPDWENVITPVLDFALARSDVDGKRVALIGLSLGAHLAPRAASVEHRLAACIADCGAYDLYGAFLARLPGPLAGGVKSGRGWATAVLRRVVSALLAKPTAGWALRRGMLVHGIDDPLVLLEAMREYTLVDRAAQITCPTWVCNAEGDEISASAPELVDALTCETHYVNFTAAEGAGDHCELGARELYHARSFGWLDGRLHPERSRDPRSLRRLRPRQ
jgi:alpha-beta hydrolase superfamily lysophospholipase